MEPMADQETKHKGPRMVEEKVKRVDPLLLSVSSGLGSLREDDQGQRVYVAEEDCLECLKDLQRFLRKDNADSRDVFFQLCEYDTARNDLLPIIIRYADNHDLVYNAIKVLTFLTMPINATSARVVTQLVNLQHIKEGAVHQPDVLAVICGEAAEALTRHPRMNEEQTATLQVCLTLIRNLLAIPDRESPNSAAGSLSLSAGAGLHCRFLAALLDAHALDLLTAVAKHAAERPFKTEIALLLDIVHEVLRGLDPESIANATPPSTSSTQGAAQQQQQAAQAGAAGAKAGAAQGKARPDAKDKHVAANMRAILAAEKTRTNSLMRGAPRLNSRDTARYVRLHSEHNSSIFLHSGPKAAELPDMKLPAPAKGAKGESGVAGAGSRLPSAIAWRMRAWMDDFARSGAYNSLMEVARRDAEAGLGISRLEAPDLCRLMRLGRTFLTFARTQHTTSLKSAARPDKSAASSGQQPEDGQPAGAAVPKASAFAGVSASLGWPCFQLVLTTWLGQVDVPVKSDLKNWELQYCCVNLLRELLLVLEVAEASPNDHDSQAADRLQRKLLHDDMKESGLLPVLCKCARAFKANQQSRAYALDIIMCLATVVRILDRLSSADAGGFVVKRRQNRGGGGRKAKPQADEDDAIDNTANGVGGEADDEADGVGKTVADGEEGDGKGADRKGDAEAKKGEEKEGGHATDERDKGDVGALKEVRRDPLEMLEDEDSEADEEERKRHVKDVQLDLNKRLMQEFAQGAIVHFLVMQGMAFYLHNSGAVNRAVAALLWRIASPDGLNLEPLLYQLSILRVMHKLLADRTIRDKHRLADYQDLLVLSTRVTRGLFSKLCAPVATEADVKGPAEELKAAEGEKIGAEDKTGNEETETGSAQKKAEGGGSGDDSDLEIEAEDADNNNAGATKVGVDAEAEQKEKEAAEEKRAKELKHAVDKENRIRGGISSMLFVDLMFWKTARLAGDVRDDYLLRVDLDDEPQAAKRGGKRGNQLGSPGAAGLGSDDEGDMRTGGGMNDWEEEEWGMTERDGVAPGVDAGAEPKAPRDLVAEQERRRKLRMAQIAGKTGSGRAGAKQLSPEMQKELVTEFQRLNAHKANMDLLLNRLGGDWTKDKITRSLKALGHRFGKPTDEQVIALRSLWRRHTDDSGSRGMSEVLLMIAADMTGGWTSKQIRSLLKKEGLLAKTQGARKGGFIDDGDESDGGDGSAAIDEDELRDAFARHQHEDKQDMLQLIATELGGGVSVKAVKKGLQRLGLIQASKGRSAKGGAKLMVDEDRLRELHETHKDLPDTLNRIAADLGTGLSAGQVQRLLVKCSIVADEGAARKAARAVADRAQLVLLYRRHSRSEDYLELMARDMPGVVTAQQVLKMMRKHGLLEAPTGGAGGRRRGGGGDGSSGDEAGWAVGSAAFKAVGCVPEPCPEKVLACLAAMDISEDCRWMRPAAAVSWLCGRLEAAAALSERTRANGGVTMDYSLIMESDQDELFFMTDHAQELLEAAGIRNDVGDFYKIPGNGDAAWRQRVRSALEEGLKQLGTEHAVELGQQFKRQQQEAAAAAKARANIAAAPPPAKPSKVQSKAAPKSAAPRRKAKQSSACKVDERDGSSDGEREQKGDTQAEAHSGKEEEDRAALAEPQSDQADAEEQRPPSRTPGRMVAVDSSSDSGVDSDSGSGDSSNSGSSSEEEQGAGNRVTGKALAARKAIRSSLPQLSSSSSSDGSQGDSSGDEDESSKGGPSRNAKKKIRTAPTHIHAPAHDTPSPTASPSLQDDVGTQPSSADNRAARATGGAAARQQERVAAAAGVDARKAALAALAAKRQQPAGKRNASATGAATTASGRQPLLDSSAKQHGVQMESPGKGLQGGKQVSGKLVAETGEAKRRRLLRVEEQENQAADDGMQDLEDF